MKALINMSNEFDYNLKLLPSFITQKLMDGITFYFKIDQNFQLPYALFIGYREFTGDQIYQ